MKKETKEAFLRFLGLAARDAEPEELERLTQDATAVLDAEPVKTPDAEPAEEKPAETAAEDEMVEKAPKGDDLGSKLDRILEMLEAKSRGGRGEHPLHDETDIDELIEKLAGEGSESALTIPVENTDACAASPARDAAVELLRKVRPAVAEIKDKAERARVTDALLSAVKGPDSMAAIAQAATDAAKANAGKTAENTYEKMCADSLEAYAALNPHTKPKKED